MVADKSERWGSCGIITFLSLPNASPFMNTAVARPAWDIVNFCHHLPCWKVFWLFNGENKTNKIYALRYDEKIFMRMMFTSYLSNWIPSCDFLLLTRINLFCFKTFSYLESKVIGNSGEFIIR